MGELAARGVGEPEGEIDLPVLAFVGEVAEHDIISVVVGRAAEAELADILLIVEVDDLRVGEGWVFVADEERRVGIAESGEVVVAAAVDERDVIDGLLFLRAEPLGEGVVLGAWTVVRVVDDGAAVALVDVARAVVADPDGVGGVNW